MGWRIRFRKALLIVFFTLAASYAVISLLITVDRRQTVVDIANIGLRPRMDCGQNAGLPESHKGRIFKIAAATLYFGSPAWECQLPKCGSDIPNNCFPTNNLEEADVILFHLPVLSFNYMLLKHLHRRSGQLWALVSQETPIDIVRNAATLHAMDGLFNWTVSYRRDSTVHAAYGRLERRAADATADEPPVPPKTGLAVIISSHCSAQQSGRWQLVRALSKLLPLTVFGRCGLAGPKCADDSTNTLCGSFSGPMQRLIGAHKFYLSFEGELCRDYITEKFWNAYRAGAVPVVLGGASKSDYLAVAPADSFIYALDFGSVKQLADYLLYLDANDTAYRQYFRWRRHLRVASRSWDCALCAQLNNHHHESTVFRTNNAQWTAEVDCVNKRIT